MPNMIVMPQLGMSMEEGTVTEWPRRLGARVEKGEVVLIIETEKSEAEVEATASGVLRHVYVEVGATVSCGTLLAVLTETAEEPFDAAAVQAAHRASATAPRSRGAAAGGAASAPAAAAGPPERARDRRRVLATPRAKRLARELGIDLEQLVGSGPRGRVTADDVRAAGDGRVEVAAGVALEVLESGEGEAVLLVPGFGADASIYAPLTADLLEDRRLLAVQPRGVGRSSVAEAEIYTVAQGAADLAVVVAACGDEPVHVVGTSLGAAMALELALSHPDRVHSLTLVAPFLTASARLLAVVDSWRRLVRECSPATVAAALLPWLFAEATLVDASVRARLERGLTQMVAKTSAASLDRWAEGLRQWSGARALSLERITAPTLVVIGAEDLLTPPEPELWSGITEVQVLVVPEAGHGVGLEAPARVAEAIRAHLKARS